MKATVYRSTGSWYDIKTESGKRMQARIKGVFKIDDITSTNPIAVGDEVEVEPEAGQDTQAIITRIYDRHNYISRQSPSHRKQHHIIASNLHQSLLVATFRDPRTSSGFVDRFLVASEAYHVPAIVVINKRDNWRKKEEEQFEIWRQRYEPLDYAMMATSAKTGEGLQELRQAITGKRSLISGHSGVGKSSLLNALLPELKLRTKEVSGWSGKGMHTTTFAEMMDLPQGGAVIDTPGLREFGLVDIPPAELSHYFPEMRNLLNDCQFNNCMHLSEPLCAVKQGVIDGKVSEDRYVSYCNMLESLPGAHWE